MPKKQQTLLGILLLLLLCLIGGWLWLTMQPTITKTSQPVKQQRVIVTTNAQAQIFNQLAIPLVGAPTPGENQTLPKRYVHLPKVGNHVAPNLEKMANLNPDMVYLDHALVSDYQTKLTSAHIKTTALNVDTLPDLITSIHQVGKTFHRQTKADKLVKQLNLPTVHTTTHRKVALLVGMPGGSFLVGTQHSYVGDLITRAGGTVIGSGDGAYTTMNVEQIASAQPDVIITMAHAMPDSVFKSFNTLFNQSNWQALPAVHNQHIYRATEPTFSMTANLNAPQAYHQLKIWLGTN